MRWLREKLRKGQVRLLTLKSSTFRISYSMILAFAIVFLIKVPVGANEVPTGTSLLIKEYYDELSRRDNCSYIYYDLQGGLNSMNNPEAIYNNRRITLVEPYKFGYAFAGWFIDSNYRYKVTSLRYKEGQPYVLHAKWNRKVDNINSVENYSYDSGHTLKDCDYSFLYDINIPGMPGTKEKDFLNNLIFSPSQCPQGLCIAKDFILVTSYSEGEECPGELIVFDRKSGEYLFTLAMDPVSHLGGIAFDGENIWVCNSSEKSIERLSYDFVENMARKNSGGLINAIDVVDIYKVDNIPSCITYFRNRLWIGTHTKVFKSNLVAYHFNKEDDSLNRLSSYRIPARVQGIAFDDYGKVYLSTSYGRKSSSYLKVYRSLTEMDSKTRNPYKSIEMPPCSEEVDIDGDTIYMIFESAGEKYFEGTDGKGSSDSPIDKILTIDIDSL